MPNFKTSFFARIAMSTTMIGALMAAPGALFASPSHGQGHGHGVGSTVSEIGAPGNAADVTRTIKVVMEDNFFDAETIEVRAGETILFQIENKGEFVHEFNIGTAAMHASHQQEMMMMMEHGALDIDKIHMDRMKMDMGNGMTMEHDDPNSVLLEPGKTAEIIWTFPADAELEFACNVPGHYESGMMGKVRLQS
ncbi:plastocyanin/azurin family copper-binding protein [Thalassospira sp. ER-Se-21-Dark]|uniref:cupredoxin domain-containing protein n=1 Tax=Thalassospira sp. ER-Se-21-Dark TaxID=2585190 RepID=UPI001B315D4D|nr:plastocyanin/azurin family copper-binding protein [Thalassospira sp. ER-Se-21-Dark]MBP3126132.1 copper-binding protein [Thalassospira sp. ER-Se-21-Dark]